MSETHADRASFQTQFQTELGQACDLLTAPEDHVDLDNFSMDKCKYYTTIKAQVN